MRKSGERRQSTAPWKRESRAINIGLSKLLPFNILDATTCQPHREIVLHHQTRVYGKSGWDEGGVNRDGEVKGQKQACESASSSPATHCMFLALTGIIVASLMGNSYHYCH